MSKQSSRSTPPAATGAIPGPRESNGPKTKEAKESKEAKEPFKPSAKSKEPSPGAKSANGSIEPKLKREADKSDPNGVKAKESTKDLRESTKNAKEGSKNARENLKDPKEKEKGPRRFRGDVEPFNPSGAYTPQMYPPQGPYPLQPLYNQQPQFVYGNQMLPYYPMMGYPDLMYQQYQFYAMANQFTPPYNQMNMNGYAPRKKHGKYYPQGQNNVSLTHPHTPVQHPSQGHPHTLGPHLTHAHGQAQQSQHNQGQYYNNWQQESFPEPPSAPAKQTQQAVQSQPPTPAAQPAVPAELISAPAEGTQPPAEESESTSESVSESPKPVLASPDNTSQSSPSETVPRNGRLLVNITADEVAQERKSTAAHLRLLLAAKSARVDQYLMQNDADFVINHHAGYRLHDHNTCNEYFKQAFPSAANGTDPNINDPNDSSLPSQKINLNWASFLQTTRKQPKPASSVTKSSSALDSSSESPAQSVSVTPSRLPDVETDRIPQSLGLLTMKVLFDPSFDLQRCDLFNVKPRGLTNSGNICYMNAVLQCLILCEPFNKLLRYVEEKSIGSLSDNSPNPLIDAAISFFVDFVTIPPPSKPNSSQVNSEGIVVGKPLSPESLYMKLIENPKFKHLKWGQQEDAEEFLGYLLDGLHEEFVKAEATVSQEELEKLFHKYSQSLDSLLAEELKARMKNAARLVRSTESKHVEDTEEVESDNSGWSEVGSGKRVNKKRVMEVEPSPITSIFGGSFRSVLTVPKAKESQSITIDPYRCILLDISHRETETIEDALSRFTEVEKIPYKSDGGKDVIARKQSFIEKLPEVLILQLKRFSFEAHQLHEFVADEAEVDTEQSNSHQIGTIEKVMKNIKYELDLTVPVECLSSGVRNVESRDYRLVGVIYHHGRNAEGGHYTCDVLRSKTDKKWLRIDDTAVESITADAVVGKPASRDKSAYILMYQRA